MKYKQELEVLFGQNNKDVYFLTIKKQWMFTYMKGKETMTLKNKLIIVANTI